MVCKTTVRRGYFQQGLDILRFLLVIANFGGREVNYYDSEEIVLFCTHNRHSSIIAKFLACWRSECRPATDSHQLLPKQKIRPILS